MNTDAPNKNTTTLVSRVWDMKASTDGNTLIVGH